jgi:hypothetical protein
LVKTGLNDTIWVNCFPRCKWVYQLNKWAFLLNLDQIFIECFAYALDQFSMITVTTNKLNQDEFPFLASSIF